MMSELNSEPASGDDYISSSAPASVRLGYHKMLEAVKRIAPTATSWGRGRIYGIAEETICKAPHQFGRSLGNNDKGQSENALRVSRAAVRCQITVSLSEERTGEAFVILPCSCECCAYGIRLSLVAKRTSAPPSAHKGAVAARFS